MTAALRIKHQTACRHDRQSPRAGACDCAPPRLIASALRDSKIPFTRHYRICQSRQDRLNPLPPTNLSRATVPRSEREALTQIAATQNRCDVAGAMQDSDDQHVVGTNNVVDSVAPIEHHPQTGAKLFAGHSGKRLMRNGSNAALIARTNRVATSSEAASAKYAQISARSASAAAATRSASGSITISLVR